MALRTTLLLLVAGTPSLAGPQARSTWAGDYRLGDDVTALSVEITGSTISVSRPPFQPAPERASVSVSHDSIRFAIGAGSARLTFEGTLGAERASGTVVAADRRGQFTLIRTSELAPAALHALAGLYRAADGRWLSIRQFGEFGPRLVLTDFATLRVAPLVPEGGGRFLGGAGLFAPLFPSPLTAKFGARGVTIEDSVGTTIRATKVSLTESPFQVTNGSVRIAGTLTIPAGTGPRPAVLIIHGSGPTDRNWGPYADFFLSRGFAVAAWDKRGVGQSGGDWKSSSFEDLAGDALAVFARVRQDRRIDSSRVGLWGISQAGWIEPLVARAAAVAFVIVHAGPGVTVAEQGIQNQAYELRAAGATEDEVAEMVAYHELDDEVTRTGTGWDSLQAVHRRLADRSWIWEPAPPDHWFRKFYRKIIDFDPAPAWRGVTAPVLALLGERDLVVYPKENRPRLEAAFKGAGLTDAEIVVLPDANHVFMAAKTGSRYEYPHLDRFVPGYFSRLAAWLDRKAPRRTAAKR
jgi:hypothetical protein